MSAETTQRTLSGDEATCGRVRPQTLVYCYECGERVLRRHRFEHEVVAPRWAALDTLEALRA